MDTHRIAELLGPFLPTRLSGLQLSYISTYIDILLKWNQKINLTAVRDPEQVVTRHFGESLFAARCLFPERPSAAEPDPGGTAPRCHLRLADVGSGGGFPGLPIKIFAPEIKLTLIESNNKKATFLREVIRSLKLTDAEVFAGRAESFPAASSELVTLRAVEQFEEVLPIAARLVAPGGQFALLIGQAQVPQATRQLKAFTWTDAIPVPLSSARVLLLGSTSAL